MKSPLVSVVMPVANVERFLAEAIESILTQSFRDFEFLIVDYGSTDKSPSIVANYASADSRVRTFAVPPCALPEARNFGCSQARGSYIAVMDADDVSLPERLRLQLDFMERFPKVALSGGAVEFINAAGESLQVHRHPTERSQLRSELLTHCTFWHPTVIVRREAFHCVGGYRPIFRYAHDYDLELRLAEKFQCANLSDVVVRYRFHPQQISLSRLRQQTQCVLAAQASSFARRNGTPDPLRDAEEISASLLSRLGVTEAAQQVCLIASYTDWIRNMCNAGENQGALQVLTEILHSSKWEFVEQWQIADLWLRLAGLHRRESRLVSSCLALVRAVLTRPAILGRPFKRLLRSVGLAPSPRTQSHPGPQLHTGAGAR